MGLPLPELTVFSLSCLYGQKDSGGMMVGLVFKWYKAGQKEALISDPGESCSSASHP